MRILRGFTVAAQCISEAFGVDVENEGHKKQHSIKPATLSSIFEVFLKTQKKRQEVPGRIRFADSSVSINLTVGTQKTRD